MSKTKIIGNSVDTIAMMILREMMPATGAYETAK